MYLYIEKETTLTRLRILLCDEVFVHLKKLIDLITLLHGQSRFIDEPRTYQGPFGNRLMRTFTIRDFLGGARLTQAEKSLLLQRKGNTGW